MRAKDLALALLQLDRGCDDVFLRVDINNQSYCVDVDKVSVLNGSEGTGLVIYSVQPFTVTTEISVILPLSS